jgi:hypothetical protein
MKQKKIYSEIYKILFFEKTKLITTKLIKCTKNNLIIVIGSAKYMEPKFIIFLYSMFLYTIITTRDDEMKEINKLIA